MRFIGPDVHRTFAEVAVLTEGQVHAAGRVATTALALEAFARTLRADDQVVLEATLNTQAIVRVLRPHVARVVIANPLRTRLIAEAKIKTDKIDAAVLAQLLAAASCPRCGCPTRRPRRCAGGSRGARSSSASGPGSRTRSTRSSPAT